VRKELYETDRNFIVLEKVVLNLKHKLIIIEGIPGVGKTTTASFIKECLDKRNIRSNLYKEGDLNHPADYESVACLNKLEYLNLKSNFRKYEDILNKYVKMKNEDFFFHYRKMNNDCNFCLSKELLKELATYDVYNLPIEKYSRLCKEKWLGFAKESKTKDLINIFECCFLQNPLTTLLAYHNASRTYIKEYIKMLTEIIQELNPILILLHQENVKATFDKVKKERPKEWLDFVIKYVTTQAYGKEKQLEGYVGLIDFYTVLSKLELKIFKSLELEKLIIKNPELNWHDNYNKISNFLEKSCK